MKWSRPSSVYESLQEQTRVFHSGSGTGVDLHGVSRSQSDRVIARAVKLQAWLFPFPYLRTSHRRRRTQANADGDSLEHDT